MTPMEPGDARAAPAARWSSSGLIVQGASPAHALLAFADAVLRGIGQVMLQNNSYTGLLFLLGVFASSALAGWAVLVGAIAGTASAAWLGADRAEVRAGLFGFNGALVGVALGGFLRMDALLWAYIVAAAACSSVAMAALMRLLANWRVPALTAPFVLTTWLFVLAGARLGQLRWSGALPAAALPQAAGAPGAVTGATLLEGLLNGVAQVFFQGHVVTGALFVVGLLISSRSAGIAALLGSLAGLLIGWLLGAAEPALRAGAFGFNPVLTAIALGSGLFVRSAASLAYAALAVLATTVAFAALSAALAPLGLTALTAPFVLVVWLFWLASPLFQRLRRSTPG